MNIRPIRTDADLDAALARVDELWGADPATPEGEELDVLLVLVQAYEAAIALPPGDPLDIVRFKLDEVGWTQNELARRLGWSSGRVSEVLNGRRELTVAMVKALSSTLDLPAGLLLGDPKPAVRAGGSVASVTLTDEAAAAVAAFAACHGWEREEAVSRLVLLGASVLTVDLTTSNLDFGAGSAIVRPLFANNNQQYGGHGVDRPYAESIPRAA